MKLLIAILLLSLFSTPIFAQGFTVDQLSEAGKIASNLWIGANADNNEKFVGFKTWRSDSDGKVKVYYKEGEQSLSVSYMCHTHDNAIECHEQ